MAVTGLRPRPRRGTESGLQLSATALSHTWRRTFSTALAAAGVPRELRMRPAGHTQEQTHDGYNHGLSRIREAIEGSA